MVSVIHKEWAYLALALTVLTFVGMHTLHEGYRCAPHPRPGYVMVGPGNNHGLLTPSDVKPSDQRPKHTKLT